MSPSIVELIEHPELLNKDTLYGLRELVARYPYFQAARLLFVQNLFILHDADFGEELRKAALFVPDRSVLFNMVEGNNYEIRPATQETEEYELPADGDRTQSLIDKFLRTDIPNAEVGATRRKLTIADATTDYMAYLMQMDDAEIETASTPEATGKGAQRQTTLIDDFIETAPERIVLQENPEYVPQVDDKTDEESPEEDYFTETLAKIYIKQGRYEKAIEIIRKLHLIYPKKNRYFADQIRFLQKLVINNKHKS